MFQSVSDVVLLFKSLASAWGVFWGEVTLLIFYAMISRTSTHSHAQPMVRI